MIRKKNGTTTSTPSSILYAFVNMSSQTKLILLATFLFLSTITINHYFDDTDDIYDAKHLSLAKNRQKVDLSKDIKVLTKEAKEKKDEAKEKMAEAKEKKVAAIRATKPPLTKDQTKKLSGMLSETSDNDDDAVKHVKVDNTGDKEVVSTTTNPAAGYEDEDDDDDDIFNGDNDDIEMFKQEWSDFIDDQIDDSIMGDDIVMDDVISDYAILFRASSIEEQLEAVSDVDALHDWTAPQGKAFQWIVNEDARMVNADDPHLLQRYALVVLYFATGGEDWYSNGAKWLSAVHECMWYESVKGKSMGVGKCDEGKNVTDIYLVENNLHGKLPREIGLLKSLTSLDIQENRLSGKIPTTIGDMEQLEHLFINSNNFKGTLPTQFGKLPNIKLLLIDGNELTGTVPTEVCSKKKDSARFNVWADCDGTPTPPIKCSCCSMCCDGLGYCSSPEAAAYETDD